MNCGNTSSGLLPVSRRSGDSAVLPCGPVSGYAARAGIGLRFEPVGCRV